MKRCELCTAAAAMYCESDQASLCWDCDSKVHSANFLVERHSRALLCHVCHSPTAWTASGSKLGRTVSVCERCVTSKEPEEREERDCEIIDAEGDDYDDDDDSDDDVDFDSDDDDGDGDDVDGDDDEDNQVVPWTWPPPPPPSSSSSGDESSSGDRGFSLKRLRDSTVDYCSDDDFGCSSSHRDTTSFSERESGAVCVDSLNHLKRPRTQPDPVRVVQCGSAGSIVGSLKRLYEHDVSSADNADVVITGICEMTQIAPIVGSNSDNST